MRRVLCIYLLLSLCIQMGAQQLVVPDAASQMTLLHGRIPRDAASLGMGATSALETDGMAFSSLSNASAASFSTCEMDFSAGFGLWQPKTASASKNIGAGFAWKSRKDFSISMAFAFDDLSEYDIADEYGVIRNSYSPSNLAVSLGAGWRFLEWLSAGAAVHYLYSNIYDNVSYGAPSFDLNLSSRFGPVMAALGVSNLGGKVGGCYSLPSSAFGALSLNLKAGESRFELRAEGDWYFAGAYRLAAGGSWNWRFLSLRTGYNAGDGSPLGNFFSLGLGLHFGSVGLDAAYLPSSAPMGGTACFGLKIKF